MDLFRQRMRQLQAQIEDANYRYYVLDDPLLPDADWDRLLRELQDLEHRHPEFADPNSPTQRVGNRPASGFRELAHSVPMLSLANAFSDDEIEDFAGRIAKETGDDNPGILRRTETRRPGHQSAL